MKYTSSSSLAIIAYAAFASNAYSVDASGAFVSSSSVCTPNRMTSPSSSASASALSSPLAASIQYEEQVLEDLDTSIRLAEEAIRLGEEAIESSNSVHQQRVDLELNFKADAAEPENLKDLLRETQSKALPFLKRPQALDGTMPGDVGFDPLGLAKNAKLLGIFREAEVKHSRLAMLAAAGWPLSELLDNKIATLLNLTPALDTMGRAPIPSSNWSANVNFESIPDIYWIGVAALASAVELLGTEKWMGKEPDYKFAGCLGFDPLGFYPKDNDPQGQKRMQTAEIKHGRTAMMAVAGYYIQEHLTGLPLIGPALSHFFS
mmetsp:Transcript_26093/g.38629  ORF Transcript_26093/g.38629 Transcript_26093/m.38629 type:complete len:319 (+) Transcript_26093:69-1025(+)